MSQKRSEDLTPEQKTEVAAQILDDLKRMSEIAQGYRVHLEAQGWSPTAAEQVAAHFLMTLQSNAIAGTRPMGHR